MSFRDLFHDLLPFVYVAEEGSFRAAARRLGQTPAAVTRAIQRLEDALGVTLFHRTTRTVSLSDEGALFLERAREAVSLVRAGRDAVEMAREREGGLLRISITPAFASNLFEQLPDFLAHHPGLNLQLDVDDALSHRVEDEVDVAVRIGAPEDSSNDARRLCETRWITAASPTYIGAHGAPERPEDLDAHDALVYRDPDGHCVPWSFADDVTRTPTPRLAINRGDLLVQAAIKGLGVVHAMDCVLREPLARGELVPLLESWSAPGPAVHALTRPGHADTPRVRALIDFLADVFRA